MDWYTVEGGMDWYTVEGGMDWYTVEVGMLSHVLGTLSKLLCHVCCGLDFHQTSFVLHKPPFNISQGYLKSVQQLFCTVQVPLSVHKMRSTLYNGQ